MTLLFTETVFCGSSAVLEISRDGCIHLVGALGYDEQCVKVIEVDDF